MNTTTPHHELLATVTEQAETIAELEAENAESVRELSTEDSEV